MKSDKKHTVEVRRDSTTEGQFVEAMNTQASQSHIDDRLPETTEVVSPSPLPTQPSTNGGVLVLQWLCYAFWFWFCIAMSWLASVVVNYFVAHDTSGSLGDALAYPLAAVSIMLLIALVTDLFYAKKFEPEKKTGGANVIMLLHVVPFVLIAIGSLVTIVFAFISMTLTNNPATSVDGPVKVMLVSLLIVVLFGLLAARAFFGAKRGVRTIAWVTFTVFALGLIVISIVGPVAEAARTKQDRLIEQALPTLANDISNYAAQHNALPSGLKDVSHNNIMYSGASADLVQAMIDQRLVTYRPNTIPASNSTYGLGDTGDGALQPQSSSSVSSNYVKLPTNQSTKRYYYQLCVRYKAEKKSTTNYAADSATSITSYSEGLATVTDQSAYRSSDIYSGINDHPAGDVCYNLYADGDTGITY